MNDPEGLRETPTHSEWWASNAPGETQLQQTGGAPAAYTDAQAASSLRRAGVLVAMLALCGLPVAWLFASWRGAAALLIGSAISGSGLWEWRRLMAALTARMDAHEAVQVPGAETLVRVPSIAFAVVGFSVRLLLVLAVLYASLKYLHGSVLALAAGLAMGVVALTVEAIRLLRSGTI